MRSLTYFALALPSLVVAQEKQAKRALGDMVVATINGQVQSWANNWDGKAAVVAAPSPPPVQPVDPVVVAPTTTSSVYQPPPTTTPPPSSTTLAAVPVSSSSSSSSSAASPVSGGGGNGGDTGSSSGNIQCGCSPDQQCIKLTNNAAKDLHIIAGAPYTVGQCGVIAVGSTCEFCMERDPAGGNLQVGYGEENPRATWLEGNWIPNKDDMACVDISYIPGYSVPITCRGNNGTLVGIPDSLCQDEACSNCNGPDGLQYQGGVCLNPMGVAETVKVNGPPPDFFAIATGKAYTFPYDDSAVGWAQEWNKVECIAHPQFGGASSKRSVEAPAEAKSKREAHAHSHVGKKHRRHQHRHGVQQGSKL